MRKTLPEILDITGQLLTKLANEDTVTDPLHNVIVLSFIPDDEILKKCLNKKGGSIIIRLNEVPSSFTDLTTADPSSGYQMLSNDDFQVISPPSENNIVPTLMALRPPASHGEVNGKLPTWGELWKLVLKKVRLLKP